MRLEAFVSSRAGERFSRTEPAEAAPDPFGDIPAVHVDPARRFQEILGIGGAFTEASADVLSRLPPGLQERTLRACFDRAEGNGYTFCRMPMGGCDFALEPYSHCDRPPAPGSADALENYSVDRDRRVLFPMAKRAAALAGGRLRLLASPWSPPAWMKDNGSRLGGGVLLPERRDDWAACYVRFAREVLAEGLPLWGFTVQNEPASAQRWDSCVYTAEEERDFVRDHLGPALESAGLDGLKLLVWDHNRNKIYARVAPVYSDPEASRFVHGAAFHWYEDECSDNLSLVHDAWPSKALVFTEGCQEGGTHHRSWALASRYARSMVRDFNRWASGWIDWNLLLDVAGGPNHARNYCSAPIVADPATGWMHFEPSYYAIGHFSRFVEPGSRRIAVSSTTERIEATGFVVPDGRIVAVVHHPGPHPFAIRVALGERSYAVELPAESIATLVAEPEGAK